MKSSDIKFKRRIATEHEIYLHLNECGIDFKPPLSEKVNIKEYSHKLFEKSITFEAWINQKLIGLIAAYFNNIKESEGFITNVSVVKDYKSHGIASHLMEDCIEYALRNKFKSIKLEVNKESLEAIGLYKKNGFIVSEIREENLIMKLHIQNIPIEKRDKFRI